MRNIYEDTIAALATPGGKSAIGLVRLTGPDCGRLAAEIFGRPPLPRLARHADYHELTGRVLDDVLYTYFAAPGSYTGEDVLEISCHGNPFIVHRMLEDLHARGCRPADPGEFTKRAFLNGRIDLSQAEAVMDLIHARSERALEAANRQLRGSLGRHIAKAIAQLVDVTAQVEAYIDFPEEDLPAEDRSRLIAGVGALARDIDRLLATAPYGALLREGVRTVIVGEPNVGKSSLLNRLVGWERALVSPEPGTTRDYLEEPRALGAHIIRFVDTAGLNPEPGELERRGIERTMECASEADLFLLVLDATRPCPSLPRSVVERLNCGNTVVVWNKADLQTPNLPHAAFSGWQQVAVSAATGSGISALEQAIVELIDRREHSIDGDFVAINARHATDLSAAAACLRDAENKLRCSVADELMAADLRGALDALGRIGGRVDHEQILDRLFACFCIGK